VVTSEQWDKAQEYETRFWSNEGLGLGATNSYHEELKQFLYAERMGITVDMWHRIDLQSKSVLDVGGGPSSLLLKTFNGKRKVIDPLAMPEWAIARYKDAGIEFEKKKAEEMDEHGWDEVWIYNVLQHVQDPVKVIEKVKQVGKIVRVFEFLERPADEGHPHVLTEEMLNGAFGRTGTATGMANPIVGKVYYGIFEYDNVQPILPMELHWVNTGTGFPYAYYLAIMSALKTQKAAKFNLWLVKEPTGRYYDAIKDKVTLRRIDGPADFPSLQGKDLKFQLAHLVDYYRYKILLENGGVLADLDSLSLSDYCTLISERLADKEFLASLAVSGRIPKPYHNSIFAGRKGSSLVEEMLGECLSRLVKNNDFKWGNSGPDVLNDLCAAHPDKVAEAEYGLLGGCLEMYQLFKPDGKLPDNIRFVHLWANSINGYWDRITEEYIEKSDDLYPKMVREVLTPEERGPVLKFAGLGEFILSRGNHYKPIFRYLKSHECKNIMEIGTYNGENAVQMIKAAALKVKETDIHYYGLDLFENITQAKITTELSHPKTPDMESVKKYIESSVKAKVTLFSGDTNTTLESVIKELPFMDMIFIDGGHSLETIDNDWKYAARLMKSDGIVFFDDYLPEMPFIGCKTLIDGIQKSMVSYDVEVLPEYDDYPKPYGHMRSQLASIQPKKTHKIVNEKPALHVLGLAHTQTTKEFSACAYTQKVLKMCQMMRKIGYEVYHYGAEGSTPDCTEHIDVVSTAVQRQTYGDYDWKREFFKHNPTDLAYTTFNENAIREINARKGPKDLLLISMGNYQKPIFDGVGMMGVEMGIGYSGVFTNRRVFESYAWMHAIYGTLGHDANVDGNYYDCVIPNYYDPADFEFCDKKDDYYLYIGRLIGRKGVNIAAECCERIGAKLIVAGQGGEEALIACGVDPKKVEYVGYADVKKRSDLMAHAKAVFVPTLYLEPFGGVNVEAAFCGTPAITTDFGGFTETVQHGKTGFRCHRMPEFEWAAKNVDKLDPYYIRDYAVNNYSMDHVSLMYDHYFMLLMDQWKGGWYEPHPEPSYNLDWLKRL
jgi:glycosyltransferase involved in cell wall biosynthesis